MSNAASDAILLLAVLREASARCRLLLTRY
nr:MAG TPA: hypothetical protein [Caudoviricetes sp.]